MMSNQHQQSNDQYMMQNGPPDQQYSNYRPGNSNDGYFNHNNNHGYTSQGKFGNYYNNR